MRGSRMLVVLMFLLTGCATDQLFIGEEPLRPLTQYAERTKGDGDKVWLGYIPGATIPEGDLLPKPFEVLVLGDYSDTQYAVEAEGERCPREGWRETKCWVPMPKERIFTRGEYEKEIRIRKVRAKAGFAN